MDEDRALRSLKREVSSNTPIYSNSWAVVIGLNQYQDEKIPNLRYAESDASAVAALLPELGFPEQNITLLLASNGEALSPYSLKELIDDLDTKMSPNDRFLLYFAGHGVTVSLREKRSGWLLTPGSRIEGEFADGTQDLLVRPQRAIDMSGLLRDVNLMRAKHKLLILDSCFSGFINKTRDVETLQQRTPDLLKEWTSRPVTEYLVAGAAEHRSSEKEELGHGVFTYHLLEGLRGAAAVDGQPVIASIDLAVYLKRRVPQSGVHQDPQYGKYGEDDGTFCFEREPKSTLPVKPVAPLLQLVGEDITLPLRLEFLEAALGVEKQISIERSVRCKKCDGKALSGCASCRGRGRIKESSIEKLRIPAGVEDGARIRLPVPGNAGLGGGPDGYVYLLPQVLPHHSFRWNGNDIESSVTIPALLAWDGGEVEVATIHGAVKLTVPVQANMLPQRIAGKGIAGGDHWVTLLVYSGSCMTVALDGSGDHKDIGSAILSADPGGTIFVKPGVYQESVELTKDVTLIAQGEADQVVIHGGVEPALTVSTDGGTVRGFSLRTSVNLMRPRDKTPAVIIYQGETRFANCSFRAEASAGVDLRVRGRPVFRDCLFHHGIYGLEASGSSNGLFENCSFQDNARSGIRIFSTGCLTFRNCGVSMNEIGVRVGSTGTVLFEECEFFNNRLYGLLIRDSSDPKLTGCQLHDNGGVTDGGNEGGGVLIQDSGRGSFQDCQFTKNKAEGLFLMNHATPKLSMCSFVENAVCGVSITDTAAGLFADCEFTKNASTGIRLRNECSPQFKQCLSIDNEFGLSVKSDSRGTFNCCEFSNNRKAGIVVYDGGDPLVQRSKCLGNEQDGLFVYDKGGGRFEDCEFFDNRMSGIRIEKHGSPALVRTKSFRNDHYGVLATESAAGSLRECSVWDNGKGDYSISSESTTLGIPPEVERVTI